MNEFLWGGVNGFFVGVLDSSDWGVFLIDVVVGKGCIIGIVVVVGFVNCV